MDRRFSFLVVFSLFVLSLAGVPLTGWSTAASDNRPQTQTAAADPVFPRGPTVHMVNKTAAMIYWKTNTETDAIVNYGDASDNLDSSVENSTLSTEHRIWIDGLTAGTTVYYQAVSDGTNSEVYHFKTEPEEGTPFRLIVLGDPQPIRGSAPEQSDIFKNIMTMVHQEEPHLIVILGDFVYDLSDTDESYNERAWGNFLNVSDKAGHYAPIYGVIGNHDTMSGERYADGFLDAFQQHGGDSTYFSFDYAGVHFTFLDSEMPDFQGRVAGQQYDWLVDDLQNTDKDVKYVMVHQPMYPVSAIGSSLDRNQGERDRLQDLFEEENVTVFLAGHDHVFQRLTVNGVLHVTSAGAGPKLYHTLWGGDFNHYTRWNVSPMRIEMETINLEGEEVANYTLPYEGHIEIALREHFNTSTGRPEEAPLILFSEIPQEQYYSWDGGDNSTELGTFPDTDGVHTLDVYAQGSDGVWNHKYYEFTTIGIDDTETTTTTTPPVGIDPLLIAGVVGVASVIVVIVIYRWRKGSM
ncbi:metallophosphoesterase family protein [Candidatus Thorarchaeota archaeon]|nr:MAG: metallophosphoesterase family protein [Candidatus Thorarchaeota archaeon]